MNATLGLRIGEWSSQPPKWSTYSVNGHFAQINLWATSFKAIHFIVDRRCFLGSESLDWTKQLSSHKDGLWGWTTQGTGFNLHHSSCAKVLAERLKYH